MNDRPTDGRPSVRSQMKMSLAGWLVTTGYGYAGSGWGGVAVIMLFGATAKK